MNQNLEQVNLEERPVIQVAACSHHRRGKLIHVRSFTRRKKRPNRGIRSDFKCVAGYKHGLLTVVSVTDRFKYGKDGRGRARIVVVRCECGVVSEMTTSRLKQVNSCGRKNHLMHPEDIAFGQLYRIHRIGAARRGLEFNLDESTFKSLVSRNCYYCGRAPYQRAKVKQVSRTCEFVYSGIDRLNSNIGYIADNCVPACGTCNKAKSTTSHDEFCQWISLVHSHLTKTGTLSCAY